MCASLLPILEDNSDSTNVVVVAGGSMINFETKNGYTEPIPSPSTLILINENWMIGPDLPKPLCCGQGVASRVGRSMFVIGGMDGNKQAVSDIYKLRCTKMIGFCKWQQVQSSLARPRMNFLALMLQNAFNIDCQQSSHDIDGQACFHTKTFLVNDGFCDDLTNSMACYYDGFDCCLDSINKMFCKDCLCQGMQQPTNISYLTGFQLKPITVSNPLLLKCPYPQWVNDSLCDMENNIKESVVGVLLKFR